MFESPFAQTVNRPTECPSCNAKHVDTLAKVITASTFWRCRQCDHTWTIASLRAPSTRSR